MPWVPAFWLFTWQQLDTFYVAAAQCLRAFNLLRQAKITLGFNASTDLNEMTEETIHKHFMEKLQLVSGPARIEVIISELSG